MLFANVLSPTTKKYILQRESKSKVVTNATTGADEMVQVLVRDDLELTKEAIEELLTLEAKSRPTKMDLSSAAAWSAAQWEAWDYAGRPDDWGEFGGVQCRMMKQKIRARLIPSRGKAQEKPKERAKGKARTEARTIPVG